MLVRFVVDPGIFSMDKTKDRALVLGAHERLLELWRRYGVLVHEGRRVNESNIAASISVLPQSLRTRWQKALRHQRTCSASESHPWYQMPDVDAEEKLAALAKHARLACLEETCAFCHGVEEGQYSRRIESIDLELCRYEVADHSEAFAYARSLCEAEIPADSAVSDVWSTRFAGLVGVLRRTVVIIDRYAARSHCGRNDGYSGLRKFLVELDHGAKGAVVKLFTAFNDEFDAPRLLNSVEGLVSNLRGGGVRELTLHLLDDATFARIAHYRRIRFDDIVCDLDVGVDVLAGERVYRTCPFRAKLQSALSDDEELKLFVAARESYRLQCRAASPVDPPCDDTPDTPGNRLAAVASAMP